MSPRIDSKGPIPPAYVAWRAGPENPTPTRFLAPIDCLKIPALNCPSWGPIVLGTLCSVFFLNLPPRIMPYKLSCSSYETLFPCFFLCTNYLYIFPPPLSPRKKDVLVMGKYREAISCRPSEPQCSDKTNFGAYFYRRRVRVYQTAALSSGAFKQENAPTGLFTYIQLSKFLVLIPRPPLVQVWFWFPKACPIKKDSSVRWFFRSVHLI